VPSHGRQVHDVVFYARDDDLARRVTDYLLAVISGNGVGVAVATPAHRAAIEARLEHAGVDLTAARSHGTYVALDAEEVISRFMINGFADPARFWRAITPFIKDATMEHRKVAVFGEMVALLWARDLTSAAVDLEALWNELAAQYPFSLLCGYPADLLTRSEHADDLLAVLAAHAEPRTGGPRGNDAMNS
jgi:MEDS: MEthanogen/methylotroph, DcmR Sensory domain